MKKMIIGVTAAIMLAGASVYAANLNSAKSETKTECTKGCCPACEDCCGACDGSCGK